MIRVLLDENLPKQLVHVLAEFTVQTVVQAGWAGTRNGELLRLADGQYDVLLTVDKGMRYQNNLTGMTIAVVQMTVKANTLTHILPVLDRVKIGIRSIKPGQILQIPGI